MELLANLMHWISLSFDWRWLAGIVLRVTVIAALAQLALALLPRASASLRHLIAVTALAAALLTPLVTPLLPAWRLALLPAPSTPVQASTPGTWRAEVPAAPDWAPGPIATTPGSATPEPRGAAPLGTASAAAPGSALPLDASLISLVVLASLILLARLAVLLALARWVFARAASIEDPRMLEELDRAQRELGLRRRVGLRASARVRVPAVTGLFGAGLLLPLEATEWDGERLRAVFLHELAHVQRRDSIALLIARSASALYWFHPLVHSLARTAQRECERACDDVVLTRGVRASDYARHLLEIASGAKRGGFMGLTLAFARPTSFESRLLAILRDERGRGRLSRRAVIGVALVALALTLPLAATHVVAATACSRSASSTAWATSTSTTTESRTVTSTSSREETRVLSTGPTAAKSGGQVLAGGVSPEAMKDEDAYSRAKRLYEQERYGDAGEWYERAAEAGIRTGTAYYNAACSFALDGQKNRALGDLVSALDAGFDEPEMLQTDSDLNSIRADRRFQLILKGQARSDETLQKRDDATATYSSLKAENSTDAEEWKSVGISLMRSGDGRLAADAFARQFAIDSTGSSRYNQACALALGGQSTPALDALESALKYGYDDPGHVSEDADLISIHGTPRFAQLVQLAEDLSLRTEGLGNWDDARGWRESLSHYRRMTENHPDFGRAWFNLGFAELRAQDGAASRAGFLRALDHGYRVGPTSYNVACASAQMGDRDAAFDWLRRAAEAGYDVPSTAGNDKDLDPLRSDPRFRALIESGDHRVASKKPSGHKKS